MSKGSTKDQSITSKVVPSLITAGIISLVTTLIPGGWRWLFSKCHVAWLWFTSPVTIPIWLLTLLSLIASGVVIGVGVRIYAVTRRDDDSTARYNEDTIFGIHWRWRYGRDGIHDLCSFCPRCDLQIFPKFEGYLSSPFPVVYHCDDCHVELQRFDFSKDELDSRVIRKIQQKLRRDERVGETQKA